MKMEHLCLSVGVYEENLEGGSFTGDPEGYAK